MSYEMPVTHFLALSKCLKKFSSGEFIQFLDTPAPEEPTEGESPLIRWDEEWLAIVQISHQVC